jgi:DNA-binding NtrC family response regulator
MKTSSAIRNDLTETIAVLSVSPMTEDHVTLVDIFRERFLPAGYQTGKVKLVSSWTLEKAIDLLRTNCIPIAISECDLRPGSWHQLLERTPSMPHSPLVIITSRLADERMWAEALNLGAWDVLAKPFDRIEVSRAVETAWLHFKTQHETSAVVHRKWRTAS